MNGKALPRPGAVTDASITRRRRCWCGRTVARDVPAAIECAEHDDPPETTELHLLDLVPPVPPGPPSRARAYAARIARGILGRRYLPGAIDAVLVTAGLVGVLLVLGAFLLACANFGALLHAASIGALQ